MDAADITAMNDFNEESVSQKLRSLTTTSVPRGNCLFCEEVIASNLIYCDSDCREGYEKQEQIKQRTRR